MLTSAPASMAAKSLANCSIFTANGRAAMMACCDLRMRAAATIFMALVIFCVDWTLRILRRKVFKLGIGA